MYHASVATVMGEGKVLHLFQMEVQSLGDDGKFRHIFLLASGMAADEIRNKLLA